jgi:hypothetical protein
MDSEGLRGFRVSYRRYYPTTAKLRRDDGKIKEIGVHTQ